MCSLLITTAIEFTLYFKQLTFHEVTFDDPNISLYFHSDGHGDQKQNKASLLRPLDESFQKGHDDIKNQKYNKNINKNSGLNLARATAFRFIGCMAQGLSAKGKWE